jgi:curved DNA-binding protein CbpA
MSTDNHYKILGVSPTATQGEIKAKYRSLVLKHHPDVNDSAEAQAVFLKLQEAFDVLSDEINRARYDDELRIASAPKFRGEPWPTKKFKYARRPDSPSSASGRYAENEPGKAKKHNIKEWERMHYGIDDKPQRNTNSSWPTGEKEDDMSNHQLYFKHRAERMAKGGHYPWSTKKFSTFSAIYLLKKIAY